MLRTGPERCPCGCAEDFIVEVEGDTTPSSSDHLGYRCPNSSKRYAMTDIRAWTTFPVIS